MTWLAEVDDRGAEIDATLGLLPDVRDHVRNVLSLAWGINDPALLLRCRLLIAQMHGTALVGEERFADELAELDNWRSSTAFTAAERAALDYAEQFVTDQNSISEAQKEALDDHFSERQVVAFVQGININDAYIRILTLLDLAFDPESDLPEGVDLVPGARAGANVRADSAEGNESRAGADDQKPVNYSGKLVELSDPTYFSARLEHSRSAMRHDRVDAVTSELIRLRNANHQQCEFCMSVRRDVVFPTGADATDPMDAVRLYESSELPEGQKVALRLADAFLAYPKGYTEEQRDEALAHYDSEQIVEILLKIMCWSQNRTPIALGMDAAVDPDSLTAFEYDDAGSFALMGAEG